MNYTQKQSLKEAAAISLSHDRLSKLSEEERRNVLARMENITEDQGTTGHEYDLHEGFISEEGATPDNMSENDAEWWSRYYYTYIALKFYAENPTENQLRYSDYNGDGKIDFQDLLIILSMWGEDFPFVNPEQYQMYMASDARKGAKQQRDPSGMSISATRGGGTVRPPRGQPDTTGGRPPQGGGGAPNGPYPPFPGGGPSPI